MISYIPPHPPLAKMGPGWVRLPYFSITQLLLTLYVMYNVSILFFKQIKELEVTYPDLAKLVKACVQVRKMFFLYG